MNRKACNDGVKVALFYKKAPLCFFTEKCSCGAKETKVFL